MTTAVRAPARLVAFDRLRGAAIALVVLHHSVLAYCRLGHVDRRGYLLSTAPVVDADRWTGFDLPVRRCCAGCPA